MGDKQRKDGGLWCLEAESDGRGLRGDAILKREQRKRLERTEVSAVGAARVLSAGSEVVGPTLVTQLWKVWEGGREERLGNDDGLLGRASQCWRDVYPPHQAPSPDSFVSTACKPAHCPGICECGAPKTATSDP